MKIVFTGDSITDSGRDREDGKSLGSGYVKILADKLRPIYPDTDIELVNRGANGYEIHDLLENVQRDVLDLHPDVAVILIGINDLRHKFTYERELDLEKLGSDYRQLLTTIKGAGITLICLEPFLLPAPDKLRMRPLFNSELEIIHRVCVEMCDEFVAYDEMFNGLCQSTPYTRFTPDGVHPSFEGSDIIANTAIKASLISFWVSFVRLVCSPCFKTTLIKHVYYSFFKL